MRKNVIEKCILTSFITIFIRDILIKNITYSLLKGKCRELSLHHLQNVFLYIFNQNIMSKILLVCYKNRITNGHVTKINSFALKEGETTSEIKFLVFCDHENSNNLLPLSAPSSIWFNNSLLLFPPFIFWHLYQVCNGCWYRLFLSQKYIQFFLHWRFSLNYERAVGI